MTGLFEVRKVNSYARALIFSHHNIDELSEALETLCSSTLFNPFTTSSELCLNAVLQDQSTPGATASILKTIISHAIFNSEKLTQHYCDKVTRYPEKVCMCAVAHELETALAYPPKYIKACVLAALHLQKPPPDINAYVYHFLNLIKQFSAIAAEDFYPHLTPLINPNTVSKFLNITSLLQQPDPRLDEHLDNVPFDNQNLRNHFRGCILPNFRSITQIYCATLQSLTYNLNERMACHLPHKPSIKKQVFESSGHVLYCGNVMRTSSLFFNRLENNRNLLEDSEADAMNGLTTLK